MRQKKKNALFTIFYPGLAPMGTTPKDAVSVAVTDDGSFVSLCTKEGCAVFYQADELRALADALHEVADLFEENQAKKVRR